MAAGIPGAGIGGLFYLASTLLLPVRSAWHRVNGRPAPIAGRGLVHSLAIALGIVGGLWAAGWLLALVAPQELVTRVMKSGIAATPNGARTVIPLATIGVGLGTLVAVLLAVEAGRLLARLGSQRVATAGDAAL